jgi:hypothetical protein
LTTKAAPNYRALKAPPIYDETEKDDRDRLKLHFQRNILSFKQREYGSQERRARLLLVSALKTMLFDVPLARQMRAFRVPALRPFNPGRQVNRMKLTVGNDSRASARAFGQTFREPVQQLLLQFQVI